MHYPTMGNHPQQHVGYQFDPNPQHQQQYQQEQQFYQN